MASTDVWSSVECKSAHGIELLKFGINTIDYIPNDLKKSISASRYVMVCDENINKLYGERMRQAFYKAGMEKELLVKVIAPGEVTKTRKTKEEIEDWMLENRCNRDTCVIAFGGGVVGDMTGFVASTFLRGVPFVQIPTSLLAMVDSSIGGKTAVDTPAGKNLIGSFYHPRIIYIDLEFLKTLPIREISNGMAEIIKTAAIWDRKLFETLENFPDRIMLERDPILLHEIVRRTGSIKAEVVSMDDREGGIRSILNFGHTIGHAIEALVFPDLLHGECVSIGMVMETKLSNRLGQLTSRHTLGRLLRCLQSYNLPLHIPKHLAASSLIDKMTLDKKNLNRKIRCVVLKSIGECIHEPVPIEVADFERVLLPGVRVVPAIVNGEVAVPGSKSLSNRVLPLCALGEGTVRISGFLHADDTRVMMDALQQLGVKFEWEDDAQTLVVQGAASTRGLRQPTRDLFLGNAGTAARCLTTLCTLIEGGSVTMTGTQRMKERPIKDLTDALLSNGCKIVFVDKPGYFPMQVFGTGLKGGPMQVNASVSSQYVSSILLNAPYAKNPVELHLQGEVVSRPYIDMTVNIMKEFGVDVRIKENDENTFLVPLGNYKNPSTILIEGDASSGSYPLAMAAITGGRVTVTNIGSKSIQGDSRFYTVMAKMGCVVAEQTETATTVQGPEGGRLVSVEIDMADMTDTFITVAACAAVANGTTKLYNIANQRVKECDRIAAVAKELGKCGVPVKELPDGLVITGCGDKLESLHGAEIECYADHRIAMSFAVLGLRIPGIIITDKDCVDKTYPEFWMDLEERFGVKTEAANPQKHEKPAQVSLNTQGKADSIVVIGMRGAGKTNMGKTLASRLQWQHIDLDEVFVQEKGDIAEFVRNSSWATFRTQESEILSRVIRNNLSNTIITCGGGIVETDEGRNLLEFYRGPVVHLSRDIEDISEYLNKDKSRANLGEEVKDIWKRREPHYNFLSHYDLIIPRTSDPNAWKSAENSLFDLVQRVSYPPKIADVPETSTESFFVSLTLPNLVSSPQLVHTVASDVDAIELRVDMLESLELSNVYQQVYQLRMLCPKTPVIFTVRTSEQGGNFKGNEEEYRRLIDIGFRTACEYVDVELELGESQNPQVRSRITSIVAKYKAEPFASRTGIILSHHDFKTPISCSDSMLQRAFGGLQAHPRVDILKFVGFAKSISDCISLQTFLSLQNFTKPVIALLAGEEGKMTRLMNNFMTPVTHPALIKAAPGQMSAAEIRELRSRLSLRTTPLNKAANKAGKFYLFGSPISQSKSPLIHNTAFAVNNLPFSYELFETTKIEDVVQRLKAETTAGGSVTIPHKQTIMPFLDEVSEDAKKINAVNTIVKENGRLIGSNTDWEAIFKLLHASLKGDLNVLVVGAGGTANAAAYAVSKLGAKLIVWNRTPSKADDLAKRFGGTTCSDLKDLKSIDAVIATIPPASNFQLPDHLIRKEVVIMELVYSPRFTPLLQQGLKHQCKIIEGIELLYEQAILQNELFGGLKAPRKEIVKALLRWNGGEYTKESVPAFRLS